MLRRSLLRCVLLRPEVTLDPDTLGTRLLRPDDTYDYVYSLLRNGHYVECDQSLAVAEDYFYYASHLVRLEFPGVDLQSFVEQQRIAADVFSRLVIPRQFTTLADYHDKDKNRTFWKHVKYFEETHWNKTIHKEFETYVEKWFPQSLHSHLSVVEYLKLVEGFAAFRNGVCYTELTGPSIRLRPWYGVRAPKPIHMQHLRLLLQWFETMRRPLLLHRTLCLNVGCGVVPFMLGNKFKTGTILSTDASSRAIESCISDSRKLKQGTFQGKLLFQTAEMFPSLPRDLQNIKFDCAVFTPDILQLTHFEEHDTPYAPGLSGVDGQFEMLFEHAHEYLRDWGVLVIVYSNFRTLLEPSRPHPIEDEVKRNRRWVVLDYFDCPMKTVGKEAEEELASMPSFIRRVRGNLKSEIWVLHRVEAIEQFGFVHGVPGATIPENLRAVWHKKRLKTYRKKVLERFSEDTGIAVKDLESRLESVLESSPAELEDPESQYLRMAVDPHGYSQELLKRQELMMNRKQEMREEEEYRIASMYGDESPRQVFDRMWNVGGGVKAVPHQALPLRMRNQQELGEVGTHEDVTAGSTQERKKPVGLTSA